MRARRSSWKERRREEEKEEEKEKEKEKEEEEEEEEKEEEEEEEEERGGLGFAIQILHDFTLQPAQRKTPPAALDSTADRIRNGPVPKANGGSFAMEVMAAFC